MKYLVLIVIVAMAFASCKKQPSQPTNSQIITTHTWYLKSIEIANANDTAACMLSEVLTFNKDSTGNFFFGILCDSGQPSNIPFKWYLEDNTTVGESYTNTILTTTLYTSNIDNKDSSTILRLSTIGMDTLQMKGFVNGGVNYLAMYTSSK